MKIKFAMKNSWKTLQGLEKFLNFTGRFNAVFEDLNQDKIVVPIFGAAYAAPNIGTTTLY